MRHRTSRITLCYAPQGPCSEWARSQARVLEDLKRLLGGSAQLLAACADAESAPARCALLKVPPCDPRPRCRVSPCIVLVPSISARLG